jgi:hypothetical protein
MSFAAMLARDKLHRTLEHFLKGSLSSIALLAGRNAAAGCVSLDITE